MLDKPVNRKREGVIVLLYCAMYLAWLTCFLDYENEIVHWLTLVLLPFILLCILRYNATRGIPFREVLQSVGLSREHPGRGIGLAFLIGLALGALQILMSDKSEMILAYITSGKVLWTLPLAFLMMVVTAGTTEEFFFRGVVQTRISYLIRSKPLVVILSSLIFGIYHLPYAYFMESWSSHGDLGAAISQGVVFSTLIGLVLGWMFLLKKNLLVPIIIHSMFNAVWAMTMF